MVYLKHIGGGVNRLIFVLTHQSKKVGQYCEVEF